MASLLGMLLLLGLCTTATAQQHKQSPKDSVAAAKKPKKLLLPQAYLGSSKQVDGAMQKDLLAELLQQKLTSKDSAGNSYTVTGFRFGYSERVLYEDSVGNLMVLTDFLTEYCAGDTLPANITNSLFDRLKAGDTVHFNQITLMKNSTGKDKADYREIAGRGLKILITE